MNEKLKVQSHHLERSAYLYIRQSSMRQVMENVESTKRQYDLRGRAIGLGWRDDQIIVIDSDQGESGASASWREGFQHLVSDVGMGRAGIVMGLEVSRLARNNADWHRLLEICALADTLILDEDGVYDPANFNDRLLLGLKGTMSEAELHVIKARLRGGILNKVRRGEYRCPLPTGFIYDEIGNVVLDPDAQIREMISHFFETFSRVGSATQTVKTFTREGLLFPSRLRNGKQVVFQQLTTSTAMRMLHNPRYAGVYAYGQRLYRRTVDGKKQLRKRDPKEWLACIPDAHPGYISWEQFQHNLKVLEANGQGYQAVRASPPREGAALLQGRVICGRCGSHMSARYAARRGQVDTWYVCHRAYASRGEPHCQSIAGWPVDEAVGELIAAEMTPAAVELALEIRKEIEARHDEADKLRLRAVERAQIDADLAQRRFMLVDPNNRLVADTLEREWNEKLRVLADVRKERERALCEDRVTLDDAIRDRLIAMTADFKTVWCDRALPNRERKRLLAYLVEDVTLLKFPAEGETRIHIRFKGGKTETLTTQNPKSSAQQVKTRPEVVELVDKLLDDHICAEIADILNDRGIRPGGSARRAKADAKFTDLRVIYLVKQYGLRSRYDRLRERGMLTKAEACAKLGITESTLVRWAKYGIVKRHAYNGYIGLYEPPGPHVPAKQCSRWNQLAHRADIVRQLNSSKCTDPKERAVV
ncbi:transposase [Bradyrhizobium centrolobii]|uniref:Transposase n=1 Tax=Bradyrhizobium centrolobii TaxID=1505087 RepID=A0A176YGL2_9BRAD|nr:recombinase family protein [Bradyrhizobium centrolobii]OAF04427.1 transposase [Bradyrhizobium centrolobii]